MENVCDEYLSELLSRYRANFDITENYKLGEKEYPAYAYFFSFGEKYVLKKEAQLWAIRTYEHVLFIKTKSIDEKFIEDMYQTIKEHMEPELVRKGEKYPEKDHMCSYLSLVVISEETPSLEIQKQIKRFKFDRGYLFNLRGHSEAKIGLVCMDSRLCLTNYAGKELKPLLSNIFNALNKGGEEKVS
ncbi:hypothetical protein [Butyrivibrio sp. YAB3001]|uniref:hypothetical protein n=1 Tax=Butyrivibrio sp. YAB3001 TaxID=1520812 RepID=UPI0008F68D68|nr:hypothetical protein [Butyrivibrio sp. YAB3001]SFB73643.1 hypothetical protein SAMN02910398_00521 [Butyrivibrio sp. YAB3001]